MTNIENKTQDVSVQEVHKNLSAYCEICKEEKVFVYAFDQSFLGEKEPMYNCPSCKSSQAYQTLMQQSNGRVVN